MTFVNHLKGYKFLFAPKVKKQIRKLGVNVETKIYEKLDMLISGEQGLDVKKLANHKKPTYRLRVGDYRVVYEVYNKKVVILVIKVDHRKDIYQA